MVTLNNINEPTERSNFYQDCLDAKYLQAIKPSAQKGITIFRPIPQVRDGKICPMVLGDTPDGLDFSNVLIEEVAINTGCVEGGKFSGLVRCSDRPGINDFQNPVVGPYIRFKSGLKKKEVPPELAMDVVGLFQGDKDKPAPFERPRTFGLMQCVALQVNGEVLEKPRSYQCVFITGGAAKALGVVLQKAHEEGIDVFSPTDGHTIVLEGIPPDQSVGRNTYSYKVTLGPKAPLPEAACLKLWRPWEQALKLPTYEESIIKMLTAFGRPLMEFAFGKELEALAATKAAMSPSAPAMAAPSAASNAAAVAAVAAVAAAAAVAPKEEVAPLAGLSLEMPEEPLPVSDDDDAPATSPKDAVEASAGDAGAGFAGAPDAQALEAQFGDLLDEIS